MSRRAFSLFWLFLVLLGGCDKPPGDSSSSTASSSGSDTPPKASAAPSAAPVVGNPLTITVAYGSEKKTWLEEQAAAFKASGAKTKSGRPIVVQTQAMGSGEAVQGIVSGALKPTVFSPASALYVTMLNNAWTTKNASAKPISPAGEPLVLSPIVVAMWKPMAEALGWPGKSIGWNDLLKVNANPKDSADHPKGVWALPPTYADKDIDRARYAAIGESDRFTLRFTKP